MLDTICQIGIFVFGLSSVFFIAKKNKWGVVLGLLSQPFWFITSVTHKQWGISLMNLVYAGTWLYAVYGWFWKKDNS